MAINLGSAYGKVTIDSSGVSSGVDNAKKSMGSLESSAQKLGATLQSVGRAMTAAVTIPMALMAKQAVMTASAYEESLNKMNVVFGENSDVIKKWSFDAARNLGMSQQQALEAAATFGNLFTSMGLGRSASADMSTGLVQLAADLASFNNLDPALVLEKLRSGLVGEVEPLRTLGINLTMAATKEKAFEMGLADANGELSQSALLQARYALMLEQSTNAQGDFARTSEGLANQLRILKGNWGDTLKILGENLLPIVNKVLIKLNEWLEWFNKADPKTQKFISTLLLIAFVAGPLLIIFGKLLPLAFSGATQSLNPFSGGIFGLIGTFVKWFGVAAMIVKVLTALGIATGPIGAGILAVQAAIAGVGASIAAVALPILLIIGTLVLLYLAFKNNFMGITDTAKQLWFIIKFYFSEGWKWLSQSAQRGLTELMDWFQRTAEIIMETFKNIDWSQVGMYIMSGLANGILSGISMLVEAARRAAEAALDAIKDALGIASDSKEAIKLGKFTYGGFASGIEQMARTKNQNMIASAFTKPLTNATPSQQQNITMQFASGLTLRQVEQTLAANNEMLMKRLNRALGGA
jgi:hypothetical protein